MNAYEKRQLFLTCFLTALTLSEKTRIFFEQEWMLDEEEITALEIKSVPSLVFNMVVANEIRKELGEADGIKEFFYTGNLYLLNVPSRFSDSGVILPIKDASRRNIKHLQCYRYAKDERPFIIGNF